MYQSLKCKELRLCGTEIYLMIEKYDSDVQMISFSLTF